MAGNAARLIVLASAVVSGCGWFGNSMRARGGAPFSLGSAKSSLWMESQWSDPDEGYGNATLLLTNADMDCGDLEDELTGEVDRDESVLYTASGLLLSVAWYDGGQDDEGYEGDYYSGLYPLGYTWYYSDDAEPVRVFNMTAFDDGHTWNDYYSLGRLEIGGYDDDGLVSGKVRTDWVAASFRAEHCGDEPGRDPDDWDTGW